MLTSLKKALNRDKVNTAVMEKALASVKDADVKDMFLDDVDSYLSGAEDDSSIGDLVDEIPEYDDEDVDDDDLEALDDISESMLAKIPDTVLTEDYSVYHGLLLGNGQFSDTLYDTIDDQTEDAPKGEDEDLEDFQSKSQDPATTTNLIYDGDEGLNESSIEDLGNASN